MQSSMTLAKRTAGSGWLRHCTLVLSCALVCALSTNNSAQKPTVEIIGLAVRVVHRLHPELSDAQSVGEMTPGWFAHAQSLEKQIVADVLPSLNASDGDTTLRFTMGRGPAGIEREAYFAGWIVIGYLLDHGWTFPRLARVKESELGCIDI